MFKSDYNKALDDYTIARRSAAIQELLARLTGSLENIELLSYDEVRQKLQAIEKGTERLTEIPLDAIVGSVGRYHDFTRKFFPKASIDQKRWARVMASSKGLSGLPPIEVYKIGEVYFVKDGNHRVSVAKQMGNTAIQAYVRDVETKVDLPPDVTPDDLIIKAEQVKFLEKTKLEELKPGADLNATIPGAYPTLFEHIQVHRYYMGLEQQREIPYEESAQHWYQEVFLPVVNIIRKRNLLRDFPERTATDLYIWAADLRASFADQAGWDIGPEAALTDLSEYHTSYGNKPIKNFISRIIKWVVPDALEGGPPPGTWREKLARKTVLEHLFNDLIVALDDSQNAWYALNQAILISRMESSRIHGIHVHQIIPETGLEEHRDLKDDFINRCQDAGIIHYDFVVVEGEVGSVLCEHAKFADLIILPLNYPPGGKPINRWSSGLSNIIRACPVPILTVPINPIQFKSLLLAYDGSIKAKEAMFIAAYFGTQHHSSITVITSSSGLANPQKVLDEAMNYLTQFPVKTEFIITQDSAPTAISNLTTKTHIDLILLGGYGGATLLDVMLGSVVDQVLREVKLPVLICR